MDPVIDDAFDERIVGILARRLESRLLPYETAGGHPAEVLTPDQAAGYLKLSERALENLRLRSSGPAYCRLSGHVRYRLSSLRAWVAASEVVA